MGIPLLPKFQLTREHLAHCSSLPACGGLFCFKHTSKLTSHSGSAPSLSYQQQTASGASAWWHRSSTCLHGCCSAYSPWLSVLYPGTTNSTAKPSPCIFSHVSTKSMWKSQKKIAGLRNLHSELMNSDNHFPKDQLYMFAILTFWGVLSCICSKFTFIFSLQWMV